MSPDKNLNWIETDDGYHKSDTSHQQGNADYFNHPIPPVRDGETGHPIGSDGNVDWGRVIRDVNERDR
jgi:hypothetical protein